MPGRVFTESERKHLDAFPSEIAELDLIRYFTLSGSDLEFVRQQRGDHNRLGFALQLCGLRYLGFCPDDFVTPPPAAITFVAPGHSRGASHLRSAPADSDGAFATDSTLPGISRRNAR